MLSNNTVNVPNKNDLSVEELNDIYLNIVPLLLVLNKQYKSAAYNFILGLFTASQLNEVDEEN